ncbi:MAG TPA: TrbI/VirB10 family protein [Acidobacteriota bacterium]|nr:TrbI/VirB10 family protein [Acidobacteriota bacterium]
MNTKNLFPAFLMVVLSVSGLSIRASQEPAQEKYSESQIVVPEGTVIPIVLTEYLNTHNSQVGDVFYADTTYPIWIQQRLVIPKGSTVRGTVTEVVRPGKVKGKGRLAVRFDDILLPNGVRREFIATFRGLHGPGDESVSRKTESVTAAGSTGKDAGTVVGTTSQGAIIGAIAGHGSGAAIGAGAGAAVGLATVLFTRGRDLVLSPGTRFDIELIKPMKFAYNEIEFSNSEINNAERDLREVRSQPTNTNQNKRNSGRRGILGIPTIGGYPF